MSEENNNQAATPPINYEEHLDWFRVFVFIILPIQFIGNINIFQRYIREFNEYDPIYASIVLFVAILSLLSIAIVIIASVKQKPIGYKVFWFYSIFIVIYKIIGYIDGIILLQNLKQTNFEYSQNFTSTYISDIIVVLGYTLIAIINLVYFSHRKFLFGIYPEEPTTPPVSKQEQKSKENNQ